jgi:hypothetical protein
MRTSSPAVPDLWDTDLSNSRRLRLPTKPLSSCISTQLMADRSTSRLLVPGLSLTKPNQLILMPVRAVVAAKETTAISKAVLLPLLLTQLDLRVKEGEGHSEGILAKDNRVSKKVRANLSNNSHNNNAKPHSKEPIDLVKKIITLAMPREYQLEILRNNIISSNKINSINRNNNREASSVGEGADMGAVVVGRSRESNSSNPNNNSKPTPNNSNNKPTARSSLKVPPLIRLLAGVRPEEGEDSPEPPGLNKTLLAFLRKQRSLWRICRLLRPMRS